ncbi:MAG TPA: HNH endonuclease [Steroidobacteraceae bacterium]|nr:HNH endonuclease [Steroidobacteraceae bacterium]
MFAQGGKCFFCQQHLPRADASIEHLVAVANGGRNDEHNCVACCKSLNEHFGSMSLKDKLRIILERRGEFRCPSGSARTKAEAPSVHSDLEGKMRVVIFNLRNRSTGRPRSVKTLSSTINELFQKTLSNHQVTAIIGKMQKQRYIAINDTKVSYSLPAAEPGM